MSWSAGAVLSIGRRLGCLLLLALFLGGCPLHVVQEQALPMPERPPLKFFLKDGNVCLSQEDAAALEKFMDKLNAYEAAIKRLE